MLEVRPAVADDLETLVDFSVAMALESEGRKLDPAVVRAGVHTLLQGGYGFTLVAEQDGQPVGMIMVGGREWSDWSNGQFWWITGVYVRPTARRAGVSRALYARVRELAQQSVPQVVGLRGCVHSTNTEAQTALQHIGRRSNGYVAFEERFGAAA